MTQEAYKKWWDNVASAMQPLPNEDIEEFAHRMTALAWFNGENAEREACAKVIKNYMKETAIMEARGCLASVAYDIRARGEQA